jgi:prevent-host-death family protein
MADLEPDMLTVPDLIPISELRQRQKDILDGLDREPVVLTQHGVAVAVLVAPRQWNALMAMVEDLDDTVSALDVRLALATGQDHAVPWGEVKANLDAPSR